MTKRKKDINLDDLEKAKFESIIGGWSEKELFRRLKDSYITQERLKGKNLSEIKRKLKKVV